MAGNVKLPVIGEVKTGYAIAGLAVTAGIVGYAYWRHAQNAGTPDSSGGSSDIDPATGYPLRVSSGSGSPRRLGHRQ
jgi:hypothetical protein